MARKIAEIYNTVLSPSKGEIISRFLGTNRGELDASWRLLDPEGEVDSESLITRGDSGERFQLPLTYRATELSADPTLCTLENGVLRRRWVNAGLKNPQSGTRNSHYYSSCGMRGSALAGSATSSGRSRCRGRRTTTSKL